MKVRICRIEMCRVIVSGNELVSIVINLMIALREKSLERWIKGIKFSFEEIVFSRCTSDKMVFKNCNSTCK